MTRGLVAFVLALLTLGWRAGGPALHGVAPCPSAPGFSCSTLDVPLDHTGRRPGTLHLAVAASDNVHAPGGVLLVIAGGPGQSAVPIIRGFAARALAAERSRYRIVAYDQRGTGAGALGCPALQVQMGASDLFPPTVSAVRACAARIGSKRQFFGSDDVVADMEALRRALGVKTWTLDGISYGSYVGERYALAYPQHVTKLVLDSVVPQVGETDLGVVEFAATRRVLRAVCGPTCVRDLATVVRRYHDGPALFDALTTASVADPTYRRYYDVPAALHAAARGSPAQLDAFVAGMHAGDRAPADALDQGLHASALCADWRFPWGSSSAPLAGREAALRRALVRLPASAYTPFDRATAAGNGFVRQCLPWPPTPPTPVQRGKIRVPTLLLNGDRDLSTPLEWAIAERAYTTHGTLVVVHGAGHSTQSRAAGEEARRAVARFLLG